MSVNKVILLGRLGKDPELRNVNGKDVVNFSIATSESYKDATGAKKEATEWHNIVIWGNLAKVAATYLHKGEQVYLEGKNRTRSWVKNDVTVYATEVLVNNMTMIGSKQGTSKTTGALITAPATHQAQEIDTDDLPF